MNAVYVGYFFNALVVVLCIIVALFVFQVGIVVSRLFAMRKEWVAVGRGCLADGLISGDDVMRAIKAGEIRMHLLSNDAEAYDSAAARDRYISFVRHSALYDRLKQLRDE